MWDLVKMKVGTLVLRTLLISWVSILTESAPLPTVTITGVHQNTASGLDTTMTGVSWFPTTYQSSIGSAHVFQLWMQPNTVGPSIYLFSPTATTSNRLMGIIPAQGV